MPSRISRGGQSSRRTSISSLAALALTLHRGGRSPADRRASGARTTSNAKNVFEHTTFIIVSYTFRHRSQLVLFLLFTLVPRPGHC